MLDWVTGIVEAGGYPAIAALMFLENLFPPIPSEVIMPLAGFAAARGELDLALAVLSGSIGSLAGAVFWYWVGVRIGERRLKRFARRHGRFLTLTPADIDAADRWFARHGGKAVFLGRLLPAVRTLISVPAGVAAMNLPKFLAYSAAGTVVWTAFLAGAGYALEGGYAAVRGWLDPLSNLVLLALILWYVYRVTTFGRHRSEG